MVDEVGEDPFGIRSVTSRNQCDHLSAQNFDFTIMQSSPSKGSIGINRYQVKDYLKEPGEKMVNGFLKYAKAACQAKIDSANYRLEDSAVGIIRHKGTPECRDRRIQLANEACVSQCPELN
jgi:hypothetical protein